MTRVVIRFETLPDPSGSRPVRQNHSTTWAYLEIKLDTMFLFIRPTRPTKKRFFSNYSTFSDICYLNFNSSTKTNFWSSITSKQKVDWRWNERYVIKTTIIKTTPTMLIIIICHQFQQALTGQYRDDSWGDEAPFCVSSWASLSRQWKMVLRLDSSLWLCWSSCIVCGSVKFDKLSNRGAPEKKQTSSQSHWKRDT